MIKIFFIKTNGRNAIKNLKIKYYKKQNYKIFVSNYVCRIRHQSRCLIRWRIQERGCGHYFLKLLFFFL